MPLVFQNAVALWALPLAAGPLMIHLWSRRRFEEEPWGAMDFLARAVAARARRIWLEDVLLLLLRTVALSLLILAFADPRWNTDPATPPPSSTRPRPSLHLFVLDGSYSMGATQDGSSNWRHACQQAGEIAASCSLGDGFLVMVMSQEPRWVIGEVSFAPAAVVAALEELQPLDAGARLLPTVTAIHERLATVLRNRTFDRVYVHWLTDLQQATWNRARTPDVRAALDRLASRATLVVHPVPRFVGHNHYCRDLAVSPAVAWVDEPVTLTADIVNDDSHSASVTASFYHSDRLLDRRTVTLPPRRSGTVSLVTSWPNPGQVPIEVRLTDDGLAVDNRRYLALSVRERLRVVCIEGVAGAAKWVRLALDSADSRFEVRIAPPSSLETVLQGDVDTVFLLNPAPLTGEQLTQIRQALDRGVGVVIAWGDQVEAASWSDAVVPDWFPGVPLEMASRGNYAVDPLGYRHPLVSPFRGNENSGLRSLPIWTYTRLRVTEETTTALALANGDPLVVEQQVGAGRLIVLGVPLEALSLDRRIDPPAPWTALPIWPSFVPLVHQLARVAAVGRADVTGLEVGQRLRGEIPDRLPVVQPVLVLPDGRREKMELLSAPPWWKWRHEPVWESGWVRLEWNPSHPPRYLAVNVDTRESRLERVPTADLPRVFVTSEKWRRPTAAAPRPRAALFRAALLSVLGALLAESLMQRWRSTEEE